MLQGYLSEWLFANFEDAWLETGHMNLKFTDMVFAGDTMEMTGEVTDRGDALELKIECEVPEEDRTVIVGSASVSLD
jgi:acyl dehydratase